MTINSMSLSQRAGLILRGLLVLILGNQACSLHAETVINIRVFDQKNRPVENAVVTATPTDRSLLPPPGAPKEDVDQIDKDFVPHVKVVLKDTPVFFPNKDDIRHHVYSFSPAKIFELPLYTGTPAEPVIFDTPGQVTLGCNIHDWMLGYIYVVDSPWFGKSDNKGTTTITAVPAGEYSFQLWHPNMKETPASTLIKASVNDGTPIELDWKITLKPVFRIPRSSGGAGSVYR